MHKIHMALKALGAAPAASNAPKVAHPNRSPVHEPQTTSDHQLRQAQQILQGIPAQLNAGHAAITHVNAAIAQINTALSIR